MTRRRCAKSECVEYRRRLALVEVSASAMMDALASHYKGKRATPDRIEQAWYALWTAVYR